MVRWVKQADGSYLADTSIAEKFMDMAIKHLGKIPGVCFYIATRAQYCQTVGYGNGNGKPNDQAICTELDPATKELKDFFPPKWGTPEALAFWKPVLDKLRDFLASRGMQDSMMFGYLGDGLGPVAPGNTNGVPNYFADLWKIAPHTRWMVTTHSSPYSWKAGNLRNVEFLGVHSWVGAFINGARWMDENDDAMFKLRYGWRDRTFPFFCLAGTRSRSPTLDNDHCVNVGRMRVAAEAVLLSQSGGCNYQGFGSWGADFWGGECRAYDPGFGDVGLGESSALWLVGRGATCPVPSCRTRMLQESLQEAEARIFVQNAVLDAKEKLGADLARRCQEVCDERTCAFSYLSNYRHNDCEGSMPRARLVPDACVWEDSAVKLYRLADEVNRALK
jgi:hypothetical protein